VVPAALEDSVPERERLTALAERFSPEDVQLFYQIALTGRRDLPLAPEPRTGFEMVMLRMLAFRPVDTPGAEATPPAPTERAPTGAGGSTNSPAKTQAAPASAAPAPAPAKPEAAAAPRPAPAAEPARSEEPAIEKPVGQASQVREPAGSWEDMVAALSLGGMAKALASHCVWVGREGDMVRLSIDKGHGHLVNPSMKERLGKALGDYLGEAVRLQIDVGEAAGETPADLRAKAAEERQRAAEAAIESDPNISAMQEAFGARVIPDSVRPVDD
jgi:DNA polymerase-3 subunit gamma/tau